MRAPISIIRPIKRSRGAILVLAALVLIVFMGLVALAVDLGVIAMVNGQLKTVADAAALAGARQLLSDARLSSTYVPATEATNATAKAIAIGQSNHVLNSTAVVLSGDVSVGYKQTPDPTDSTFVGTTDTTTNSVQVTAKRDGSHGGVVPAFFSLIWRPTGSSATVTSTATIELYSISGYTPAVPPSTANSALLPIALSQSAYNSMFQNPITDNYSYSPDGGSYGTVTSGADGVPETSIFPDNSGPGNWGTINIGVSDNSTSTIGSQIQNGITPAQMAAAGDITVPTTFTGNPGLSAGISDYLSAIVGKPVAIPLYSSTSANGNNLTFNIVQYVGVRIVAVSLTGNSRYVVIQPAYIDDSTANPGTPSSGFTSGGLIELHMSR